MSRHPILALLLLSFSLSIAACNTSTSHPRPRETDTLALTPADADAAPLTGTWTSNFPLHTPRDTPGTLLLRTDDSNTAWGFPEEDRFHREDDRASLTAAVGALTLQWPTPDAQNGTYTITRDQLAIDRHPRVTGDLSNQTLLQLILRGLDEAYLDALTADDHTVTWPQVLQLRQHNVTADYVQAIRKARTTPPAQPEQQPTDAATLTTPPPSGPLPEFSTDDIVYLSAHGISADFIREFQTAGYRFDAEQLYYLRSHGITAEFAAALRQAGYDLTPQQLYYLRSHGINDQFAAAVRAAGYDRTPEELYYLRSHGITLDFARAIQKAGYNLSDKDLYYLRSHGITPDFAAAFHDLGYRLSPQELYYLRSHGITADYARQMASPEHELFTPEQLYRMKSHGVDPALVDALRSQIASPQ